MTFTNLQTINGRKQENRLFILNILNSDMIDIFVVGTSY